MHRTAREGSLQAAVLTAPERLELRELERPVTDPAATTIRVLAVGICGTDASIFRGSIPVAYPRVMGHEVVGEVVRSPEGAFEPGTRVVVDPNLSCGSCPRCREGRENICSEGGLLGRDVDGALREEIDVPTVNVYAIAPELEDHVAPLVQVLSTCVHGQRRTNVVPGESVVVVGLGVTGLLHVQLAKLRGASRVIGVTRSAERLELGRTLGADVTIRAGTSALDLVREASGGGTDVAIECAGTVATLGDAVRMVRGGGRILAYGTIADPGGSFPFYDLYYKELVVTGARAARAEDFPAALGAVASGGVRLEPLVAERVPLEGVAEALATGSVSGLKTIVEVRQRRSV